MNAVFRRQRHNDSNSKSDNPPVIRVLARTTEHAGFQHLDETQLGGLSDFDVLWLDISGEEPAQVAQLLARFEIDRDVLVRDDGDYFRAIDERPDSIHVVLSVPEPSQRGRLVINRVSAILQKRIFVIEHDKPVPALDHLWDPEILDRYAVRSAATLLALFSRAAGRQILPLVEELEERIDGLEDLAFEGDPKTLTEAHTLRRELITLRRVVGRQRDIMEYLSTSVNEVVVGDHTAFMIATENAGRLADALESGRGLLGSVLDTYRGAVADQTNEIIRLLTVFSAILLPLTLIAGILGMNFEFIPTADQSWGFWVSVAGMAAIALGLWVYFATRGFVGRPRLRELPKAVGLGLIQVGTAPVRALASGVETTLQHLDPRRGSTDERE